MLTCECLLQEPSSPSREHQRPEREDLEERPPPKAPRSQAPLVTPPAASTAALPAPGRTCCARRGPSGSPGVGAPGAPRPPHPLETPGWRPRAGPRCAGGGADGGTALPAACSPDPGAGRSAQRPRDPFRRRGCASEAPARQCSVHARVSPSVRRGESPPGSPSEGRVLSAPAV